MVQLRLPTYEGPLGLLLELIEAQRLEISELSLAQVADQYLQEVARIQAGALPDAGDAADALAEFLVIGARLMLLKARTLAPSPAEPDPEEEAAASELVEMVEEYRRYRDAIDLLGARDRDAVRSYAAGAPPPAERPVPEGVPETVTLQMLTRIAEAALRRAAEREAQRREAAAGAVERDRVTVRSRVADLRAALRGSGAVSFREWIADARSRLFVVVSLLAVLELHKSRAVALEQEAHWGDIRIRELASASADAWAIAHDSGDGEGGSDEGGGADGGEAAGTLAASPE